MVLQEALAQAKSGINVDATSIRINEATRSLVMWRWKPSLKLPSSNHGRSHSKLRASGLGVGLTITPELEGILRIQHIPSVFIDAPGWLLVNLLLVGIACDQEKLIVHYKNFLPASATVYVDASTITMPGAASALTLCPPGKRDSSGNSTHNPRRHAV